ncbi:MAG: hypothetical protein ACE1ZI_02510 [Acidobacteriota bacterium]
MIRIDQARSVTCSRDGTYVIRLTGGRQALDPERLKQRFFEQESTAFLTNFDRHLPKLPLNSRNSATQFKMT